MNAISEIPSVSNVLATRALIVSLTISQWTAHKFDRKVSQEVNETHKAASDASRVNKSLLPKKALEEIQRKANAVRTEFNGRTLPWLDDGQRVLAAEHYVDHAAWFQKQKAEYEQLVADFLTAYPAHVDKARARLGDMFNEADYPTPHEIAKKFDMTMRTMTAPSTDDMRISISDAQAQSIRAEVEKTIQEATNRAVSDVYRRVREVCERMVDRLSAYKPAAKKGDRAEGTFRNSLVENVRDLISVMPSLNITGDPKLDDLAQQLEALTAHDADVLRISEKVRDETKNKAQAILDGMGAFVA
ncbi:conserved hypothetical protein [Roseibium sp. TrichSKD4]|uniref:hypothetical protein n=1 Tax=Roseibium sp. TrichSKD4 TaxID=744980 RepID=UPI0001E56B43|nr:hypothetical protein [Roseibium sp. TrichSKD4]EFO30111.1 conserved hypothetical protein [Roseibium sp. TrichSKD4]